MKGTRKTFFIILLCFFMFILISGGTVYASDNAKPGDLLFTIDTGWESIQRFITRGNPDKTEFEIGILEERLNEYNHLLNNNGDNSALGECLNEMNKQQVRTEEQIANLEQTYKNDDVSESEFNQIRERYENQINEGLGLLNQFEHQVESEGDTQLQNEFQEVVKNYQNSQENIQQNKSNDNEDSNEGGNNENQNQQQNRD